MHITCCLQYMIKHLTNVDKMRSFKASCSVHHACLWLILEHTACPTRQFTNSHNYTIIFLCISNNNKNRFTNIVLKQLATVCISLWPYQFKTNTNKNILLENDNSTAKVIEIFYMQQCIFLNNNLWVSSSL